MIKRLKTAALFVIASCMLFNSVIFSVNAYEAPCLELTSIEGKIGETIEISLVLHNNPGITAMSVNIDYSADDLELQAVENGGMFENGISTSKLTKNPFTISWYASDSGDKTDNGVLAILRFRIKENANTSSLTLSYDEDNIFDSSFTNIAFLTENSTVTVTEDSCILGDVNGDGDVNINDVTELQRYFAYITVEDFNEKAADIDNNGLDINDVTLLQRYLAKYQDPYQIGEAITY